jgi:HEAT repeat protein
VPALARALGHAGWATAIDASAALALVAGPADAPALVRLLDHRSRWVRGNAAWGLGRLRDAGARAGLLRVLERDRSEHARRAAARALSRLGGAASTTALAHAAEHDPSEAVREAAAAGARAGFEPPARGEWREWTFVEPGALDARVVGEAYVIVGADGLASTRVADARGEASEEWAAAGEDEVVPRSQERNH